MALRIMVKKPIKMGIWITIGRQPPIGFTLFSFQSSMVLRCAFIGSSLYFSLMAASCGWSACIRFIERVLAAVSGQKTTLIRTVMATMVQP